VAGGLAALCLLFGSPVALAQVSPLAGSLDYEFNSYTNITTAATTTVKTIPTGQQGQFYGFCVNTVGTTSTLVAWDSLSASGTKIGTFTTTAVGCYQVKVQLKVGLTIVTTGSPAADITVLWR
jgi:hypothetical protein